MRFPASQGKADANQAEIIRVLKDCGYSVEDLHSVGGGCPDLLVGGKGENWLLEVKNKNANGKLNKKQIEWFGDWRGQRAVVTSPEDALRVVGAI